MENKKIKVMLNPCDQCLFSKNKIVSDKRKNEAINAALRKGTHFTCHKATIRGEDICCKGFYDRYKDATVLLRLAQLLGLIEFVDVPGPK